MNEYGIHTIPLSLPQSLVSLREDLEKILINAQQRLKKFAEDHGWDEFIRESFADQAQIFDEKMNFDVVLKTITGTDPGVELPNTYSAALENRVLLCVSPELYHTNYPEGDEEKAYEKLITHEMAHRLHIRILKGDEDAMGPVWFFEGFAIHAAGQFEHDKINVSPVEIERIINLEQRSSYRLYGIALRYFLQKLPLQELVANAGKNDFNEWLRSFYMR
jgi:hypothetical protein